MRSSHPIRAVTLLLLALFLYAWPHGSARAQDDLKGNVGQPATGPPPKGNIHPAPRGATTPAPGPKAITGIRVITKPETSLTVVARPNARVTLTRAGGQGRVRRASPTSMTVPAGEASVTFSRLRPGAYLIRAELDGHTPAERRFNVAPNKANGVDLDLAPITYDVTLRLNAPSGTVFYSKDGETRMAVPFKENGVVLPDLERGTYALEVEPDDASYLLLRTPLNVPAAGVTTLTLERRLSTEEFSWNSSRDWALPSGWRVRSLRLATKERGLALPSADQYRYYKDFELSADVRMVNGVGVSFALRADGSQRHYLIQLTGRNADEPYVLRGFIVKDGVERPLGQTLPIRHLAETLKQGKDFHVSISMQDNVMRIEVADSETADLYPIGILSDPSKTFRIGGVGVAVRQDEEFEVGTFTVCTPACPKPSGGH